MLAYVLALVVGSGSLALYLAAFFFPEIYRKNDFIWSGVGLFYALVLWVYAGRITGGLLLGQVASVSLLGWLGWQTVMMRRQQTPAAQQTALPTAEDVQGALSNLTKPETLTQIPSQLSQQVSQLAGRIQTAVKQPTARSETPYIPPKPEDFGTAGQQINETIQEVDARIQEAVAEGKDRLETRVKEVQTAAAEVVEDTIAEMEKAADELSDQAQEIITEAKQSVSQSKPSSPQMPKPSQVPQAAAAKGSDAGPLGSLFGQVQSTFKKLTQKENKPVYVRKQYREGSSTTPASPKQPQVEQPSPATEPAVTEADLSDATFVSADESARLEQAVEELESIFEDEPETGAVSSRLQNPFDQEQTELSASPPVPEAVPPHPPSPDLVEAAIADAEEKHVPAAPPSPESDLEGEEPT